MIANKTPYLFFILLSLNINVLAQTDREEIKKSISTTGQFYGILSEFKQTEGNSIRGSYYLYDNGYSGYLLLRNDEQYDIDMIKYDINNHIFEIVIQEKIKFLDGRYVKEFSIFNTNTLKRELYINVKIAGFKGNIKKGFVRKVLEGNCWSLYSQRVNKIKKSNYVPSLDAGSKSDNIISKLVYYFADSVYFYSIPHRRNKFLNKFKTFDSISTYMKDENLKTNNVGDLSILLNLINRNFCNPTKFQIR